MASIAQIPTNGLVAYYPFNGDANDASGNGNNGTVSGATLTTDRNGNINAAYHLSNSGSKIDLLATNSYLGASDHTISFWFKTTANGNDMYVLTKRPSCLGGNEQFFEFRIDASGSIIRYLRAGGQDLPCSFNTNAWNNLVFIKEANTVKIYLNNVLVQSQNAQYDQSPNAMLGVSSTSACITNFGQNNKRYVGDIDDIAIYNRALTPQEVNTLFLGCNLSYTLQPVNQSVYRGDMAFFTVTSSDMNVNYQWQINTGLGFNDLMDNCNYQGSNSDYFVINWASPSIHNATFRCIASTNSCFDTSDIVSLTIDTTHVTVYDTLTTHVTVNDTVFTNVTVYDTLTTHITIYDTVLVSVTDTLIINAVLTGLMPPSNVNIIKAYPNPASDHLIIDNGNYALMNGYTLKITNALGQVMFTSLIAQQQFTIDLSNWSGNGTYFIHIIDTQSNTIDIKKIVLQ